MGLFSFLFGGGKYPTTSKYEAQLAQFKADYAKFSKIAGGADLKTYEDLKNITASADFKNRVDHLKNDKFSQTDEYRKEQELKALSKSSDIKGYLKFINSGDDKKAEAALASQSYAEFLSLQKVVGSAAFASKAKDKNSDEAKTLARFKQLEKDPSVKAAIRYAKSSAYANYKKVAGSERLKKFMALSEFVKTDAFLAKKKDLEDKNRFRKSDEARKLENLAQLEKNKDLRWFFDKQKSNAFRDADRWQLVFSDEFAGSKLDSQKWGFGYWASKASGVIYSLADERQKFTEANAKIAGGCLDIQTRVGKAVGTVWSPEAFGFAQKEFEASSAVINTGVSFRQKFGKFEFKVKTAGVKAPVIANIWLSSEKNEEINVASFGKVANGFACGAAQKLSAVTDLKPESDFYIYSLEWNSKKIVWRVNGVEVYSQSSAVPQDEMFVNISANVIGDGKIADADLLVEWIKVYSEK